MTGSKPNPVRNFATKNALFVHNWPLNIIKKDFDVGLVVSFGHLIPEDIINSFPL